MASALWALLLEAYRVTVCQWLHGGGDIKRDEQGRINWQCRRCGRWSSHPVPRDKEPRP